jgi:hypothetical protein
MCGTPVCGENGIGVRHTDTPVCGEERCVPGLVGKPEGKRPLGRQRIRWEDNIKMDFQEVGCGAMGWVELVQCRDRWRALVNGVMKLRVL